MSPAHSQAAPWSTSAACCRCRSSSQRVLREFRWVKTFIYFCKWLNVLCNSRVWYRHSLRFCTLHVAWQYRAAVVENVRSHEPMHVSCTSSAGKLNHCSSGLLKSWKVFRSGTRIIVAAQNGPHELPKLDRLPDRKSTKVWRPIPLGGGGGSSTHPAVCSA